MVIVNAPMKRNDIKELIANEYPSVEFVSEVGMKITYKSVTGSDEENAALIKTAIKNTTYGAALYFQVVAE